MKGFLPRPPKNGRHEGVKAVKRSVISSLKGVPLHQLAETLSEKDINDVIDSEICSNDNIDNKRKRKKDKKKILEAGDANVEAAQRTL